MSAIKKGTQVVQVMPEPIRGVVSGYRVNPENGERQTEVAFVNEDGDVTSVFFNDDQIEVDTQDEEDENEG